MLIPLVIGFWRRLTGRDNTHLIAASTMRTLGWCLNQEHLLGQGLEEVVPDREETKPTILWHSPWDDWKGNTL